MRLALIGLAALVSACAAPSPQTAAPDETFSASVDQVMVFAPASRSPSDIRGYVALVYRGLPSPERAVFEQVPYPNPPVETIATAAPGVLVPVERDAPASHLGEQGDVLVVLDAREGAVLGGETVEIEILEATRQAVRYRVLNLTP
jgi:hypothetical protein